MTTEFNPRSVLEAASPALLSELARPWAPGLGERVLVACSGGADSVALLYLLAGLAPGRGYALAVASLDHGLRAEHGADDLQFVTQLGASMGIEVVTETRSVERLEGQRSEDAARRVRHRFLTEVADRLECSVIALGHTLDDQAETLLHRLGRGSGLAGMGAMQRRRDRLWRPLLGVRRRELRTLLENLGAEWREDACNEDPRYLRNRIRRDLLPALEATLSEAALPNLARAAELARDDEALLSGIAGQRWQELGARPERDADGRATLRLERKALLPLPPALLRRILRKAIAVISDNQLSGSSAHVLALESLVRAETHGTQVDLPGEVKAVRRAGSIWFTKDASSNGDER